MICFNKGVFCVLLLFTAQANAVLYKNPVTGTNEAQKSFGISFAQMSRDVSSDAVTGTYEGNQTLIVADVTIGITNGSAIELRLGLDNSELDMPSSGDGSDGILLGAIFRSNIGMSSKEIKMGGFASLQSSTLSNDTSDTDILVIDFGLGVSKSLENNINLYGGGVLSILDGTVYAANGNAYDFESNNNIGVFGGLEKSLQNNVKIGVELNLVHQTGFAAYFEMPF